MRALAIVLLVAGCGDVADVIPDGGDTEDGEILVQLQALPGVTVTEETPVRAPPGYRYFVLRVTQPVDHGAPGATFQQRVSLLHIDRAAPMIAYTSGYDDYVRDRAAEPTNLLRANQISIEHRFFGESRPVPPVWSTLTIAQMAADEHAIIALLKRIYRAPWVSSGGSKGGMTAVYHRRFFPDDVAGTVAYVAPQSFGVPDARYASFVDAIGTTECRAAIRAYVTEMIANRRAALLERARNDATAGGHAYTRIAIEPALESAIRDFEWTFWQYFGVGRCSSIPPVTASDDDMWRMLDLVSPVSFNDDATTERFDAYFYQAFSQLGSPGGAAVRGDAPPAYLERYVQFREADYAGALPVGAPVPVFDPGAMRDIDSWVQREASHIIFEYGEWDPWTGGKFTLGNATDALVLINASGTHGSVLASLPPSDRASAFGKLAAWTGVTPAVTRGQASDALAPRRLE